MKKNIEISPNIEALFGIHDENLRLLAHAAVDEDFARLVDNALDEVGKTLSSLARFGLFEEAHVAAIAARASVVPESDAGAALSSAAVIFEAVPEVL